MNEFNEMYGFSEEDWKACMRVLEQLKTTPLNNPENQNFATLITKIQKEAKRQRRQANKTVQQEEDHVILMQSKIALRALENSSSFSEETSKEETFYTQINAPKNCYVCNGTFDTVHSFYHRLCPACAEENYQRRFDRVDLSNRKAIITGGRVKVGYATALLLLRCKATVIITTRFPALAIEQFQQEEDYHTWSDRLSVYGLDLRNLSAVNDFIEYYISTHETLDILIQNAAQTIKYTNEYYAPLIQKEAKLLKEIDHHKVYPNTTSILTSDHLLETYQENFDALTLNRFGQPVDNREKNSWNSTLSEISTQELLEVNLINHISPYLLLKALTPCLEKSSHNERFVVNVTSSEGQFSYGNKTLFHPHTNMTKAALNMLTRTSAMEYEQKNIFMTSIDVGWISTGANEKKRQLQFQRGQIPPLDSVDGAARILYPIREGIVNQTFHSGVLLKNYKINEW